MTRIAFAADLHVDQYGSRIDPATGLNARLVDYLNTVRFVATEAQRRECDALVIAGDVCERKHVNAWLAGKIGEALQPAPQRTFLLEGNHDGSIGGESIVTVIGRMSPSWTGISRPAVFVVDDTALAFIPHLDGRWLRTQPNYEDVPPAELNHVLAELYLVIARGLYAKAENIAPRRILVVHQGLSGGAMSEQQAAFLGDRSLVVDAAALGSIGFDAIVAGHFHKHQVLSTDPLTVYAGSVERVDFAEEHEEKGFVVIDTDALPAFEFVPTPARRYVTLDWSTPDRDMPSDLMEAVVGNGVVRVLNVPTEFDSAEVRRQVEAAGAFEITEIRRARVEQSDAVAGLSESLSAEQALDAYFAEDHDRVALVQRGREILQEVA